MGRNKPRRSSMTLTAGVAGLALCLWYLATALPMSRQEREPQRATPHASPENHAGDEAGARLRANVQGTNPSRSLASRARTQPPTQPDTNAVSFAASSESHAAGASSLLPLGHDEIAADGLPVNALRCTQEGGVLKCGSCSTDGDCPSGQGCVPNRETHRFECMTSECEADAHCFPGFACRAISTGTSDLVIRRCVPEGVRREGETCDGDHASRAGACGEGLRCIHQVCAAPCRLEDPESCPAGYACTDSLDGPGCIPDCQQLGCPRGQQCKRLNTGESRCLARVSGTCPETPCAEGERCNMEVARGRGSFWCARLCNPLRPDSCPSGYVCGRGGGGTSTCYRKCDSMNLDACGEGWMCSTVSEDFTLLGCTPTFNP